MNFYDELPPREKVGGRQVSTSRLEFLEVLKANPGKWAKYLPSEEDPFVSTRTITLAVRRGAAGFTPRGAWESAIRRDVVYIRYVGENADE